MAKDDMEKALQDEIEKLKNDLGQLQTDIRDIADTLVDQGRKKAKRVKNQVEDQVESGLDSLQECLEQRPISTLLAAFGVGLLAGKLLGRK